MPDEPAASGEGAPEGSDPQGGGTSSGSGVPAGYVPQTELDAVEARRRSLQGERDRFARELEALKGGQSGNGDGHPQPQQGLTSADVLSQVERALAHRDAMQAAKDRVSQDFGLARPEVLSQRYDSTEEFIAAAARSHESEKRNREALQEQIRQSVLADLEKAKPGSTAGLVSSAPQSPPAGGEGGKPELTPERFMTLTFAERMALTPEQLAALAQAGA